MQLSGSGLPVSRQCLWPVPLLGVKAVCLSHTYGSFGRKLHSARRHGPRDAALQGCWCKPPVRQCV